MSPRWFLALSYLLLILGAAHANAQMIFIKTAFCIVWSATFVSANCAPCERFLCRILASRIIKYCRTYPCTNYGSPSANKCTSLPFGCLPWRIKTLGLCQPFKICCHTKSDADFSAQKHNGLPFFNKQRNAKKSRGENVLRGQNSALIEKFSIPTNTTKTRSVENASIETSEEELFYLTSLWNQTDPSQMNFGPFQLRQTPEEYMRDWLQGDDDDDPVSVERTIKRHYDKLISEVSDINDDEMKQGKEPYGIPSFEEFRSMALGETPIQR